MNDNIANSGPILMKLGVKVKNEEHSLKGLIPTKPACLSSPLSQPAFPTCLSSQPLQPTSSACLSSLSLQPISPACTPAHLSSPSLWPATPDCYSHLLLQPASPACLSRPPLPPAYPDRYPGLLLQPETSTSNFHTPQLQVCSTQAAILKLHCLGRNHDKRVKNLVADPYSFQNLCVYVCVGVCTCLCVCNIRSDFN